MTRTPAPDPARRRRRAVPPCGVRGVAVHPSRQVVGQRRRLRGTLAAGLPVVLVSWGYAKVPPQSLGADALIDRFADLPAALAAFSR